MCGQHPGRMSRVGGVMFMSLVFYMFQSILSIFVFVEKINYFHRWGVPPPHSQNPSPSHYYMFPWNFDYLSFQLFRIHSIKFQTSNTSTLQDALERQQDPKEREEVCLIEVSRSWSSTRTPRRRSWTHPVQGKNLCNILPCHVGGTLDNVQRGAYCTKLERN